MGVGHGVQTKLTWVEVHIAFTFLNPFGHDHAEVKFFRMSIFFWLWGWQLKITAGLMLALIAWVQLSMGICKSKKKLYGKVILPKQVQMKKLKKRPLEYPPFVILIINLNFLSLTCIFICCGVQAFKLPKNTVLYSLLKISK